MVFFQMIITFSAPRRDKPEVNDWKNWRLAFYWEGGMEGSQLHLVSIYRGKGLNLFLIVFQTLLDNSFFFRFCKFPNHSWIKKLHQYVKCIYSLQVQFGCLVIGEWGQLEKCCRIRNRRRSQKQKQEYLGPWGTIPWRSSKSVFSDGEELSKTDKERIIM